MFWVGDESGMSRGWVGQSVNGRLDFCSVLRFIPFMSGVKSILKVSQPLGSLNKPSPVSRTASRLQAIYSKYLSKSSFLSDCNGFRWVINANEEHFWFFRFISGFKNKLTNRVLLVGCKGASVSLEKRRLEEKVSSLLTWLRSTTVTGGVISPNSNDLLVTTLFAEMRVTSQWRILEIKDGRCPFLSPPDTRPGKNPEIQQR